jgi:hypothetical protein
MATTPPTTISITQDDLHLTGGPTGIQSSQIEGLLMTVYIVAGIVAVIVIVIGGVRYTVSGGDSAGVKAAKDTVLYAVIGLVVVIAAAAITDFVIKNVAK